SFAQGVKLSEFFKYNPLIYRPLSEELVRLWLKEALLGSGFFHMDLHQGNVLAKIGSDHPMLLFQVDGLITLNLLDFGMTGLLPPELRAAFMKIDSSIKAKDSRGVIRSLQKVLDVPMQESVLDEIVNDLFRRSGTSVADVVGEVVRRGGGLPEVFLDF